MSDKTCDYKNLRQQYESDKGNAFSSRKEKEAHYCEVRREHQNAFELMKYIWEGRGLLIGSLLGLIVFVLVTWIFSTLGSETTLTSVCILFFIAGCMWLLFGILAVDVFVEKWMSAHPDKVVEKYQARADRKDEERRTARESFAQQCRVKYEEASKEAHDMFKDQDTGFLEFALKHQKTRRMAVVIACAVPQFIAITALTCFVNFFFVFLFALPVGELIAFRSYGWFPDFDVRKIEHELYLRGASGKDPLACYLPSSEEHARQS